MKRKLVKQGGSALTVTLPSGWIKKHNLKQGDEVEINEAGKHIQISIDSAHNGRKTATLNLDGTNRMILDRYLEEFYITGVEEVILTFTHNKITDLQSRKDIDIESYVSHKIDRFIGMEIVSQTSNKIVVQGLMNSEDPEKIDVVKSRIYFLTKEMVSEFCAALDQKKFQFNAYSRHDNIVKLINYYLRLLLRASIKEEQKTRLFNLFNTINFALDKMRHTTDRLTEMKSISPKCKEMIKELLNFFAIELQMLIRKDYPMKELDALIRRRYELLYKIMETKYTAEEMRPIYECKVLLNTISDFVVAYAATRMEGNLSIN